MRQEISSLYVLRDYVLNILRTQLKEAFIWVSASAPGYSNGTLQPKSNVNPSCDTVWHSQQKNMHKY